MYVYIDLDALLANNFEHRVLRAYSLGVLVGVLNLHRDEKSLARTGERCEAAHKGFCWTFPLYKPSRSLQQFRTQDFLRIGSTAVQRCARKSTEFASASKIVGENRGEMENSLVTQDSTQRVLLNIPVVHVCVDRPSRSPHERFRTQGSAHRAY